MQGATNCHFCRVSAKFQRVGPFSNRVHCPRCGEYDLITDAERILQLRPIVDIGAVSGWVRYQNMMGITPVIDSNVVDHLRVVTKPSFRERAERFLVAAADKVPSLNETFEPVTDELIGVSYSDNANELLVILNYLAQEGLLSETFAATRQRLSPKGYIAADDLRSRRAASTQGFVAMWFSDQMKSVYENGLEPGIRHAGFTPMLINKKEHANKIDDEIIAEIRRSAFIVADFTGHRQNVYFECGFAIGLDLPVIWTCKKEEIRDLHFDIRQYNSIDWKDEADLAKRLTDRIRAKFGQGPLAAQ
jgi:nucleoside 2-deoxyribosyltransferase